MEVKLGINRVGGGSKPLGCAAAILQLVEPSRVVPIVVPNTTTHTIRSPSSSTNPPCNLSTTTWAVGPSQMSQPLDRLHQMTVVCPSDPNRILLLCPGILEGQGVGFHCGADLQPGNPLFKTLSPPLFQPGGRSKLIF